jgi:hypothetical protein
MNLMEIIEQLKACNFECIAGKLENNIAFQELEKRAYSELMMTPIPQNAKIYTLADFDEKVKTGEIESETNESFGYYATSTHFSYKRCVYLHPIESWMTHVVWFEENNEGNKL